MNNVYLEKMTFYLDATTYVYLCRYADIVGISRSKAFRSAVVAHEYCAYFGGIVSHRYENLFDDVRLEKPYRVMLQLRWYKTWKYYIYHAAADINDIVMIGLKALGDRKVDDYVINFV